MRTASTVTTLMMEAVRTFETLVYFNETTRRHFPEGYYIYLYILNPFISLQFNRLIRHLAGLNFILISCTVKLNLIQDLKL
jgi:hypothetical protein